MYFIQVHPLLQKRKQYITYILDYVHKDKCAESLQYQLEIESKTKIVERW